jgi:hypothetical protein
MTVDEKKGQFLPTSGISPQEQPIAQTWLKILKKAKLAVFNIKSVERLKKYKGSLLKSRLKSHCFWDGRDSWLKLLSHSTGLLLLGI